jgi:hypothetical protein
MPFNHKWSISLKVTEKSDKHIGKCMILVFGGKNDSLSIRK